MEAKITAPLPSLEEVERGTGHVQASLIRCKTPDPPLTIIEAPRHCTPQRFVLSTETLKTMRNKRL